MKLTQTQIQKLFTFTRQHFVEYYDVQVELVDHLANDIENSWEQQPNLSFIQARDISFKKFGICGFMDVVEEKQKQLQKKYWKNLWGFVIQWFKFPKIILTITLIFVLFQILKQISYKEEFVLVVCVLVLLYPLFYVYKQYKSIKKRENVTGKKWLFERTSTTLGNLSLALQVPFQVISYMFVINPNFINHWGIILGLSTFFTILIIIIYIATKVIPLKIQEQLANTYLEYKLANTL